MSPAPIPAILAADSKIPRAPHGPHARRHAPQTSSRTFLRDKLLLDAPRIRHTGAEVPALGGIPLLYELGRGGMGAVYFGVHPRLMQDVAVKVLNFSADDADPGSVERFRREAELGARVRSEHLVGVLDVDEDSGLHFIVMEFVEGASAQELLRRLKKSGARGLPESDALNAIVAASVGLAAAHGADVIHRDIKPGNILIPRERKSPALRYPGAKLADLGLAFCESLDFRMTRTGAVMGTPGFMAPEQLDDSKSCGAPADIFSMGVTLYALLAGTAPFAAKGPRATADLPHKPIREIRPDISAPTVELLERCLQKDPSRRYGDGAELVAALRTCLAKRLEISAELHHFETVPAAQIPAAGIQTSTPPGPIPVEIPTEILRAETPSITAIPPPKIPAKAPATVASLEMPAAAIPAVVDWASSIDLWKSHTLELGRGERLVMLLIPAGTFQMGSPDGEAERGVNEKSHAVEITRPFYMGKFAVTQGQFKTVRGFNRSYFSGPNNPVENVSWFDATIFCDLLSGRTGKKIQLPTEAQWEYACRAGTATPFYCGATIGTADANYNGTFAYGSGARGDFRKKTLPVGSFKPNAFDLCDMHGNVYEWCRDAYMQNYEKLSAADPFNPTGESRVVRGGSWYDFPGNCRAACRSGYNDAYPYVGFRVVVDARSIQAP